MTYTLADAIRDEFERTHLRGTSTLLCVACRRRKDREDFRETPWHGRAAACKRCEGVTWLILQYEQQQRWALEQEREKVRMLRRHVQHLRYRRLLASVPSSADAFAAYHQPYYDALERAQQRWGAVWATALDPGAFERPEPKIKQRATRTRLTKENR
ncbi:hypothetical protein J7I94_19210 [Streptomyces sp. ISL-12]|uniref:hypothetical protein n=1 Tax=Streptomyces sp. ISL-12 TaxID=2819177 RepID=UPI001BE8EC5A|nr:hypothetical protein [Streptomyces sp. ISL-12]MBT2412664.1 hypothetical protein [Streptomyces sp. ISL-12]